MAKRKAEKSQQEVPVCIFCGSKPVSEEHIWSRWLKEVVAHPGQFKHYEFSQSGLLNKAGGEIFPVVRRTINGHTGNKVLKKVCVSCNGGWMGVIETNAQPIMTSLIKGEAIIVSEANQQKIAKWGFLKTIIAEHISNKNITITQADRRSFKETNQIPKHIHVYITRINQPSLNYLYYPVYGEIPVFTNFPQIGKTTIVKFQQTIFIIGNLLIYVVKSPYIDNQLSGPSFGIIGDYGQKLYRIHPLHLKTIHWETVPEFSFDDVQNLRNNTESFMMAVTQK